MWIRRAVYEDLLARASSAEAIASSRAEQMCADRARSGRQTVELRDARAEIKRLTNVIIQLKERGYALRPEDTDERWGSYNMADVEAAMIEQPRQRSRAPTPDEADVMDFEQEIRAAVDEALVD